MKIQQLPIAIIGGGPVGLAAAAHLAVRKQPFILFEKGNQVSNSLHQWRHIRMFSPWEYNVDKAAEQLLLAHGWTFPPKKELPTGGDLIRYYLEPLASLPEIKPYIRTKSKVISIGRQYIDKMKTTGREQVPFEIQYEQDGTIHHNLARAVIDATGTWDHPNPIGAGGNHAIGEAELHDFIYYGIPDVSGIHRSRYLGKKVAVVGSGHSAINSILELERLNADLQGVQIVWILRKQNITDAYGGGESDALPARGELGLKLKRLVDTGKLTVYAPFRLHEIRQDQGKLSLIGTWNEESHVVIHIDEIIANTGFRPGFDFLQEVRYHVDPALDCVPDLAELIDPNIHSCGSVRPHGEAELRQPERDFYIVGSKSYGRAPTFLMATGYEQVRSIIAGLMGEWESAKKVELNLPETGVCRTDTNKNNVKESQSCCGPAVVEQKNESPSCC